MLPDPQEVKEALRTKVLEGHIAGAHGFVVGRRHS